MDVRVRFPPLAEIRKFIYIIQYIIDYLKDIFKILLLNMIHINCFIPINCCNMIYNHIY